MAQFNQHEQRVAGDQYNIGRDLNVTVLTPPIPETLQRELHDLADRLRAFRLLDSYWIEEIQQSEQNVRFYEGFRATWSDLIRGLDARRDQFPELLKLTTESAGHRALIAIISEMGSGKTTVLKRLALELYSAGSIVLYRKEASSDLSADEIRQFVEVLEREVASRAIYLCIDDATRVTNLSEFVSQLAEDGIKAVILLASRTSEWRDANLALTANLDYDPVEFLLLERLSSHEVEELSSKLHLHGYRSKPLKFDSKKSILVTMMEATRGRGFHEIIKDRIRRLHRKGDILLRVYEYTCLLGQFGLPMPLSVLEALFPRNDILADVLSQPLFREVVEYIADNKQITAGHELIAQSVIKQQYGSGSTSHIVLVEMFVRLMQCIPSELPLLVVNLLLGLGRRDSKLAHEVILRSDQLLAQLKQKSSADDLSRGWASVYKTANDYQSAEECHLKSLELVESSHSLTRYGWFLRNRNRFIEARRYLERAIAIAPDDAGAHSMFGRLLTSMLLYQEAAEEFESALRIRPSYLNSFFPIYLPILIYLAHYERAEELCRAYLQTDALEQNANILFSSGQSAVAVMNGDILEGIVTKSDLLSQGTGLKEQLMWWIALVWILLLRNNASAAESEVKALVDRNSQALPRVDKILTGRFRRKLYLSDERMGEIQTLLDRYLPKVESGSSAQAIGVPDELLDNATLSVNVTSSVTLSSQAEAFGEEPIGKLKPLASYRIIETTVKQLRENGQPEAILEYLDGIVQQDAGKWNTPAHLEYAKYLEAQGKYTEAEDHLITAVVYRNPESSLALLQYACFLVGRGRLEEARNYFQHALATPKHRFKEFTKGAADYVLALLASNNLQEAITICEQHAIPLANEQVIDALIDSGCYEELERFVRAQLSTTSSAIKGEAAAALVIALVRQERYQEIFPYQPLIVNLNIKQVQPLITRALARALAECATYLVRQHILGRPSRFINAAVRYAPDNPYVLSAQAEMFLETGHFSGASRVIDQLRSSNPDFGLAHALHGQPLNLKGHTYQAYPAFEQATNVQKKNPEALVKYCNFLAGENELLREVDSYEATFLLNLALEHGEAAYQLQPSNLYVSTNYAHVLRLAGELEQADIVIQRLLKRCPDDFFALTEAGKIKASLGQLSDAVNYYEAAIAIAASPSLLARAHGNWGTFLLSLGDLENAYKPLKKARAFSRPGYYASLKIAEWEIATGKLDLAEVRLTQVIAGNPEFVQARLRLADLLVAMGQTAQAIAAYAMFAIECWEVGRLLAAVRAGNSTLQLLNSLRDDTLQIAALTTGLLAGRAANLNPYTKQTANRILQDVSNWLTTHPKTKEFLETQVIGLEALLQPNRLAADESFVANSSETILAQFLRSHLKLTKELQEQQKHIPDQRPEADSINLLRDLLGDYIVSVGVDVVRKIIAVSVKESDVVKKQYASELADIEKLTGWHIEVNSSTR